MTTVNTQPPNEIAEQLLEKQTGDELVLHVDEGTELSASVVRPLHLPSSVQDGVDGASLRYAVEADEQAAEELGLSGREGVIAAEEVESGSWNRSRVQFYEVVSDDGGDDRDEFGDLEQSLEIVAIDG